MPHAPNPLSRSARLLRTLLLAGSVAVLGYGCGESPTRPENTSGGGSGGGGSGGRGGTAEAGSSDEQAGHAQGGETAASTCGNGEREGDEECDDGNLQAGDGCDSACRAESGAPACGDSLREGNEECDDGNLRSGDGCDDQCQKELCGNGRVDSGEECDPPQSGSCTENCSLVRANCGNAQVDGDEECDDGNDEKGDGCFECRMECGDKRIDASIGEECDYGLSPAVCSEDCKWLPACGDGVVQSETGEECDPSNGVTCVACHKVAPDPRGCGAGGSQGEGGCGGAPTECVPQGAVQSVQNGNFDTDTTSWAPHSTIITLTSVSDGDPAPKSVDVAIALGDVRAVSGAYQCVPIGPSARFVVEGRYRVPTDAPSGVGASLTLALYQGTLCEGTYLTAGSGPLGTVRDAWTPYQYSIDGSALAGEGRLLVRLNVLRPGAVSGSHVLWDSVALAGSQSACGNCMLDASEECDDGNQVSGDGCTSVCTLERCGDGAKSQGEECDDGNVAFGATNDDCTPSCRTPTACDLCARSSCTSETLDCLGLEGDAKSGPARGAPRSGLCDALRTCVQDTSCDRVSRDIGGVKGAFLEGCYCGTAGGDCFTEPGLANGSCRQEVEAALETTDPTVLVGRLSGADARYPLFRALNDLLACEGTGCGNTCVRDPVCGDGTRQDRDLTVLLSVGGRDVPCQDDLTVTGRGCSFEECDDGNTTPGDGCDEHCLLEQCGDGIVGSIEQCDDGNTNDDDGCSKTCRWEFTCGDSVTESIEQCDPPGGDHACTPAEYQSDPSACGCSETCQRAVCGDGKIQKPIEECDPPDGVKCSADCKRLDQGPCERCISEVDGFPYDEECEADPACLAVERCVLDAGCYLPVSAACYCGVDTSSNCEDPKFKPIGPCHELIATAAGPPGLENSQVLFAMGDLFNPAGLAFLVVSVGADDCHDECFGTSP